jgi:hippurate hydrolase
MDGIDRRIKGLARAHRAPEPSMKVVLSTPPTVNTPALVARVVPALKRALGADHVRSAGPVMGSEDFGLFAKGGVPIFMFRLGSVAPERFEAARSKGEPLPSLHSAKYQPEPSASIRTGVRAMTAAVLELMKPPAEAR